MSGVKIREMRDAGTLAVSHVSFIAVAVGVVPIFLPIRIPLACRGSGVHPPVAETLEEGEVWKDPNTKIRFRRLPPKGLIGRKKLKQLSRAFKVVPLHTLKLFLL